MSSFTKKTLLITGGTGSFGNAVLHRFLKTDIGEIRVFSRDEKKQDDMRHEFQATMPDVAEKIKFYIGDVRDLSSVKSAMHGVDYIFHAAALKQVPSCEFFPMEAVRTNVIGTDNVLTAAIDEGVKAVICLSTDKAAYPVNAMGITKALEERVAVAKSRTVDPTKTKICCTRYGNVMCSRGSVIPLWIDQIKKGQKNLKAEYLGLLEGSRYLRLSCSRSEISLLILIRSANLFSSSDAREMLSSKESLFSTFKPHCLQKRSSSLSSALQLTHILIVLSSLIQIKFNKREFSQQ